MAMMGIIRQDGRTWIEDMMSPDASQEREGDRRNLTVSLSLPLSGNGNESQGAPNSHLILYCLEPAILHIQYASTPDCNHNSKT